MAFDVNKIIMESLQEFEEEQQTITEQEIYMNPYEKYVGGTVAKGIDALKGTYREVKSMWDKSDTIKPPEGPQYTDVYFRRVARNKAKQAAEAEARRAEAERAAEGEQYSSEESPLDKENAMKEAERRGDEWYKRTYGTTEDYEPSSGGDVPKAVGVVKDTAKEEAEKVSADEQYPSTFPAADTKEAEKVSADEQYPSTFPAADTKEAATGTAQQVIKKTAKNVMDYDPNVSIKDYLRRAINRTGQAMGVKKSEWDTEAGGAGVQTHLAHAGKRFIQGLKNMEPEAVYPTVAAGALAAGLGALRFAKKARKVGKQPA